MQDTPKRNCSLACRNLFRCIRQVNIWQGIAFVYTTYQIHHDQKTRSQALLPSMVGTCLAASVSWPQTHYPGHITIHGVMLNLQLIKSSQHAWREWPYLPQNSGQRLMPVGRCLCCGWTRFLCCSRQDMLGSWICICYDRLASVSAGYERLHVMSLCNVSFVCKASGPPNCCVLLIDKHTTSNELTESQNSKVSVSLITSCAPLHQQTMFLGSNTNQM